MCGRSHHRREFAPAYPSSHRLILTGLASKNPQSYADSLVEHHKGESFTAKDGHTVTVPDTIEDALSHPDIDQIIEHFEPAGLYSKGMILVSRDHMNRETFEEEMFHATVDALPASTQRLLKEQFGSEEKADHAYVRGEIGSETHPYRKGNCFDHLSNYFSAPVAIPFPPAARPSSAAP